MPVCNPIELQILFQKARRDWIELTSIDELCLGDFQDRKRVVADSREKIDHNFRALA